MKYNTILAFIFLLLLLFALSLPSNAQKQVRVTEIIKEKSGKMILKGKDMQGNDIVIRYGYHAGFIRKTATKLVVGVWLTLDLIEDNGRCRVRVNE